MNGRCSLVCSLPAHGQRLAIFPQDDDVAEAMDPQALAAAISRLGRVDRAWTSPALRARQTAAALNLTATAEDALRDCNYGNWIGRRLPDIQAEEPEAAAAWLDDPAAAPHGGESVLDLLRRIGAWLDARLSESGHAAALTHPAVIRAAVIHVLQAPPRSFWRLDAEPLCIADLRAFQGRWTVRSIGAFRT